MMRSSIAELGIAIRLAVVVMLITGIMYPLAVTGLAQGLFPGRANGSLIKQNGRVIGSSLIGQNFSSDRYFHGRPSATTDSSGNPLPYNAAGSGPSNLGPTNPALILAVEQRAATIRCQDGLVAGPPQIVTPAAGADACAPATQDAQVPVDAVTSSGSGLDPDISVAYAELQAPRVAAARHLPEQVVWQLVQAKVLDRQFGILGERRVNVLDLNLALDGR